MTAFSKNLIAAVALCSAAHRAEAIKADFRDSRPTWNLPNKTWAKELKGFFNHYAVTKNGGIISQEAKNYLCLTSVGKIPVTKYKKYTVTTLRNGTFTLDMSKSKKQDNEPRHLESGVIVKVKNNFVWGQRYLFCKPTYYMGSAKKSGRKSPSKMGDTKVFVLDLQDRNVQEALTGIQLVVDTCYETQRDNYNNGKETHKCVQCKDTWHYFDY